MPTDLVSRLQAPEGQTPPPPDSAADGEAVLQVLDRLLLTRKELSTLTALSERHLARLDAAGELPGRVVCGRAVRYSVEAVRQWIDCSCDSRRWEALHGKKRK